MKKEKALIPQEVIEQKIYLIRGKKVMLDSDLAKLYCVETRVLNQAVRRNAKRFPIDFMFQLNDKEFENWVSQIVIPNPRAKMGLRIAPLVFTEQGVAMLSSVLKSDKAVEVNVQIIRTFVKLREMIVSNKELRLKMEDMERKYDKRFKVVFDTLRSLIEKTNPPVEGELSIEKKEPIGFKTKK